MASMMLGRCLSFSVPLRGKLEKNADRSSAYGYEALHYSAEDHLGRDERHLHGRRIRDQLPRFVEARRILDHVDGWVKPATLTALMVSN